LSTFSRAIWAAIKTTVSTTFAAAVSAAVGAAVNYSLEPTICAANQPTNLPTVISAHRAAVDAAVDAAISATVECTNFNAIVSPNDTTYHAAIEYTIRTAKLIALGATDFAAKYPADITTQCATVSLPDRTAHQ
jgi:hypothetical protein